MKSTQRDAIKLAKGCGLEVLSLEHTGGTHYKLSVKNKDGNVAFFVMANTASDKVHATRNNTALLRKFAAGTYSPIQQRGTKQ